MIKKIIKPIIKPLQKSATAIKKNFLERKVTHLERMIEQGQEMNRPVEAEMKYKEQLKKKLENPSKSQNESK